MSQQDQLKWDRKYIEDDRLSVWRSPCRVLTEFISEAPGRNALDVACGTGRNTLYLAAHGFEVDALDISPVALQILTEQIHKATDLAPIHTRLVDLDDYIPPTSRYDLIIQSNFLDRRLIPHLATALTPGGLLIIDTYMHDPSNEKRASNKIYLLEPGELLSYFDSAYYNIRHYASFWNQGENHRMRKQAIVVQRL